VDVRGDRRHALADADAADVNVEGFRADVMSAPDALRSLAESYAAPGSPLEALPGEMRAGRRLLFVGMGSSKYAADTVVTLLRGQGIDAHAELASATVRQPPSPDTVVFAISASGTSEETIAAAHSHLGTSLVVAVTNRPGSPLAASADIVLPVLAGEEAGGIACKSYQCTLAVLMLVAGRVLGDAGPGVTDLLAAADASAALIGGRDAWLSRLTDLADGGLGVWVAAPAERFGTAEQSSLMLREAPRIVSAACETGDWLHVDVYLTKRPGYVLLLLAGSPYDAEVMDWQRKRGFTVVSVGRPTADGAALAIDHPGSDRPLIAALVQTAVAELLAAELWERHPI
jgi:glutamine---fructose-6-phosphate transaminase (isomerizing)